MNNAIKKLTVLLPLCLLAVCDNVWAFNYQDSDLLLVFGGNGGGTAVVFDIGSVTNYLNLPAGATVTVNNNSTFNLSEVTNYFSLSSMPMEVIAVSAYTNSSPALWLMVGSGNPPLDVYPPRFQAMWGQINGYGAAVSRAALPNDTDNGVVFKLNTDGSGYAVLKAFKGYAAGDGTWPQAGLLASGGGLYGTSSFGGTQNGGTVFLLNSNGMNFTLLDNINYEPGDNEYQFEPEGQLVQAGGTLYGMDCGMYDDGFNPPEGGAIFAISTNGGGYSILHVLDKIAQNASGIYTNSDGAWCDGGLALSGATLYGTASGGGSSGNGVIFAVAANGTSYTVIKNFQGSDGASPDGQLLLAGNTLYGTTAYGGSSSNGVIFRINTDGTGYSVLKSFSGLHSGNPGTNSDGSSPNAGLILSGNMLYGTTYSGGAFGNGVIFTINTNGSSYSVLKIFSTLVNYPATNSDGANPNGGLLLSGSTLYGTTYDGGVSGGGTVFAMSLNGTGYQVLKNFGARIVGGVFNNTDGANPNGNLVLSGGTLHGTTQDGGTYVHNDCVYNDNYTFAPNTGQVLAVPVQNTMPGYAGFFQLNVAADPLPSATKVGTFHMDAGGNLTFTAGPN